MILLVEVTIEAIENWEAIVKRALAAAAFIWLESELHPAKLHDEFCSITRLI